MKKGSGFHEEPHHTRVGDMMMPFVLTLSDGSTISHAAAVMAARGVHRLLLLSSRGEAIGMVHALDLLRWFARSRGVYVPDDPEQIWRRACESALSPFETAVQLKR
jgi:CBS domain-containing protein